VTMSNNKKIDLSNFDFNEFKAEALSQLKSGQCLTGKDGILTPLIKELLEAALEGEMDAHMDECHESGLGNRRNGKASKLMKSTTGIFDFSVRDKKFQLLHPAVCRSGGIDNILRIQAVNSSYLYDRFASASTR